MSTSQHIILDALVAHAEQVLDPEDFAYAMNNEPQSVTFFPSAEDGPYDEDDVAAIRDVGDRDMHARVMYWQGLVDQL
ncbi:hypothetical protein SEA_HEXBUG_36 [Gordonia phage Hexbug]|nr:hypothetical protein SEA_ORLA_36 [Gordonia phage Orla]UVK62950.1 hypothetical protein SEA_HEXBUG_36 [Gordonia phage Hexbug]